MVGVGQFKAIVMQEVTYQENARAIVNEPLQVFFVKSVEQQAGLLSLLIKRVIVIELSFLLIAFTLQLLLTLFHLLETSLAHHTCCTKEGSESKGYLFERWVAVFSNASKQNILNKDFCVDFTALASSKDLCLREVKVSEQLDAVEVDDGPQNGLQSDVTVV